MRTFRFIVYKKLLGVFLLCEPFNSLFTRSYQVCFFYANISIHCLQEVIRCLSSMRTFQFIVYKKLLGVFLLCEHFNSLFTTSYQVSFFYANISIHCLQEVIRCVSFMRTFQFIVYKKLLGVFLLCDHFNSLFTRSYQVCFFYANISIHCLQEVIRCVSSMRPFQYIVYKKLLGVFLLCEHFNSLFTRSYQVCFFYAYISIRCLQEVIRCVSSMRTFQFIVYKKLSGVFLLCEHFNSLFTRSYQVCFFYANHFNSLFTRGNLVCFIYANISIHCLQEVVCFFYANISIHCLQEVITCVSSMRTFQFIVYKKLLGVSTMRSFQFIVYKKLLGVFLLCEHFNSLLTRSYQVCFFYANISIHCLQEVIRCVSSMRTFQFIVYKKLLGVFLLCEHFNSLFTRSYQVCFFYAHYISIHCLQEVIRRVSSVRTFQFIVYKKLLGVFLLCEHFNSLFTRSYQVCFFYANISIHCLQEVIRCVSSMRTFRFIVYKKLLGVFLLCEHFNSLFTRSYQVCFILCEHFNSLVTRSYQVCFFFANISIHCLQEVIRCVSSMHTFQLFTRSYQNISIRCLQEVIRCFFYANISIHCSQEVIRCVSSMRTFQFIVYKKLLGVFLSMRTFQFIVYKKLLGVFLLCEHFNSLFTRSYQVCFFYAIISIHCLQEVIRCVSSMRTFQFIVYKKLLGVFLLCEHFNSLFTRSYQVCFFYANISIHCLQEVIRCVSSMRTFQFIVYNKLSGVFLLCEHFNSLFTRSYQVCFFYANISIHCLQEVIRCVSSMRTFQFIVYKKLLGVFLLCEHFNSLFTRSYQVCFFYANISIHCLQEVIRCVSSMRTFQFIVYKKLLGVFLLCEHFNSLFTRSYQVCFFYANISIHCLQEVIRCVSSMRTFQFIVYKKLLGVFLLCDTFQFIVYKKLLGVFLLCEHFNSLFTRSYQVCFFYANISIHCLQEVIRCVSSMRTFQFIVYKKLLGVFLLCEHSNSLFTSYQVCFFYAYISIRCLQEVIRCVSSMRTFQFIVYKKLLGVFLLCEHFNSLFTRSYQVCFFYANISIHCLQEVIRCVSSMRTFQFIVYKKLLGVFLLLCEHFNSLFTRSYQVCFFYANISIHCLQEVIRCVSSMRTFQFIVYKKLLGVFLLCEHFNSLFTKSYQVCFFYANISIHCLQEVIRCVSSMRTFQFIVYKKLLGVFLLCEHFNSLFTRSYQVCFFYANISIHCLQEVIRCVSSMRYISIRCLQEIIRRVSSMRTFQFTVYKKLLGVFLLCIHFNSLFTRSYQVCFFYANISIHCLQEVIRCLSSMRTFQFIVYKKLLGVFLLCEHFNSLFTRSNFGVFSFMRTFSNSLFYKKLCGFFYANISIHCFTRSLLRVFFFYANISIHCLQEVIRWFLLCDHFNSLFYKKFIRCVFFYAKHFNSLLTRSYQVCFFYAKHFQSIVLQEVIRCVFFYANISIHCFTINYQVWFLLCEHFNSLFTRSLLGVFSSMRNLSTHCFQEVIRCVFLLCEHFNSLFYKKLLGVFSFMRKISIQCVQEVIRCLSSMRNISIHCFTRSYQVCFLLCEHFNSLFYKKLLGVVFFYANISIHCLQEVITCVFLLCEHFNSLFTRSYQVVLPCDHFNSLFTRSYQVCFLLCEHFNSLLTRSYQVCFFYANISIHCLQEVIRCVFFYANI